MNKPRKIALLISVVAETLFFGGIIAGYGSLQYILIIRGVYGDECIKHLNSSAESFDLEEYFKNMSKFGNCDAQTNKLTLSFTLGIFFGCFSLLLSGPVSDTCGVRVFKLIAAAVFGVGITCIALTARGRDWLIFPGLILISSSGVKSLSANMNIAKFYPGFQTIVVTFISGAFDSSAFNFQLLKMLYLQGYSYGVVFGIYGSLGVLVFILNAFLYPKESFGSDEENESPTVSDGEEKSILPKEDNSTIERVSFFQTAFSAKFGIYLFQFASNYLGFYAFVSFNNEYVIKYFGGDLHAVKRYSSVFAYMLMCGILVSPLPASVFAIQKRYAPYCQNPDTLHKSVVLPFCIASFLGVLMYFLYVIIPSLQYLYAVYAIVLIYRTFTFAAGYAYISVAFPHEHLGKLFAMLYMAIGLSCLVVFPLNVWLKVSKGPAYLLLALTALTFANPVYILTRT